MTPAALTDLPPRKGPMFRYFRGLKYLSVFCADRLIAKNVRNRKEIDFFKKSGFLVDYQR
jgi:hypothetical protein